MKKFVLVALLIALAIPASAASITWTGNAGTNLMSNAANWDGNVAPTDDDTVIFPAGKYDTIVNDLAVDTVFRAMVIHSGYHITGNRFGLYDGIEVTGSDAQIDNDIFLAEAQEWVIGEMKHFRMKGMIATNGQPLTLQAGTYNLGADLFLDGGITGNGDVAVASGHAQWWNSVHFDGNVSVDAAELQLNGADIAGDVSLRHQYSRLYLSDGVVMRNFDAPIGRVDVGIAVNVPGVTCRSLIATNATTFNVPITPGFSNPTARISVQGPVDLGSATLISENFIAVLTASAHSQANGLYDVLVIDNDGTDPISGTFRDLPEGAVLYSYSTSRVPYRITYVGGDGNDVVLSPMTPSETSISASPASPSHVGDSVTFTATVSNAGTGTVTFLVDDAIAGTFPLSGNTAVFSTSSLTAGQHKIEAQYSGDANVGGSSRSMNYVVIGSNTPTQTTVWITPGGGSSWPGETVTINAVVQPNIPLTGQMAFVIDGTTVGMKALVNGAAQWTTNTMTVGTHTIEANYQGDAYSAPSSGSTTHVVKSPTPTTTAVDVSPSPSNVGQNVTITATVTSTVFINGLVQFTVDGNPLESVTANGLYTAVAVLTTNALTAGVHYIGAQYVGSIYTGASADLATHVVQSSSPSEAVATSTSLAVTPGTIVPNEPLTLTAQVASSAGIPQGSVAFYDGEELYEIVPLDPAGNATTTIVFRDAPHTVKAIYLGSATHAASTSAEIVVSTPPRRRRAVR